MELDNTQIQDVKEYRRYVRHTCSFLGFALCILFLVLQGFGILIFLFADFLSAYAAGGGGAAGYGDLAAALSNFLLSDGFSIIGVSIISYGIAIPVMLLLLRRIPEVHAEPKKMRFSKFLMFILLVMGGGYIFNFLGVFINALLAEVTQRGIEQLNPVTDMLSDMSFGILIYSSLVAPFFEEIVFRKIILNRMRPLGEKAAVVFSAVLFGLLHGNIAQFLYATMIGLIFGYVAVKTGRIFYCVILHIIVNSYSAVFLMGMFMYLSDNVILLGLFSILTLMCAVAMIIGFIVIVMLKHKEVKWKKGNAPEGVEYRDYSSAMFLNPGFISILAVCLFMILFYALWA